MPMIDIAAQVFAASGLTGRAHPKGPSEFNFILPDWAMIGGTPCDLWLSVFLLVKSEKPRTHRIEGVAHLRYAKWAGGGHIVSRTPTVLHQILVGRATTANTHKVAERLAQWTREHLPSPSVWEHLLEGDAL